MNDKELKQQIKLAKRRVAEMDMHDGWRNRELGTIAAALRCGLSMPETGAQFDALVMLDEIALAEKQARAKRLNGSTPNQPLQPLRRTNARKPHNLPALRVCVRESATVCFVLWGKKQ